MVKLWIIFFTALVNEAFNIKGVMLGGGGNLGNYILYKPITHNWLVCEMIKQASLFDHLHLSYNAYEESKIRCSESSISSPDS